MSLDASAARHMTGHIKQQQRTIISSTTSSEAARRNPPLLSVNGLQFIPPNNPFARAVVMADKSDDNGKTSQSKGTRDTREKPASNLTLLLNQELNQKPDMLPRRSSSNSSSVDEADSASGPPRDVQLGSSAPTFFQNAALPQEYRLQRLNSLEVAPVSHYVSASVAQSYRVRRCMSSKEIGTLAPPSGSPYALMLTKKEELETTMRERLKSLRQDGLPENLNITEDVSSSTSSSVRKPTDTSNATRVRKRAEHAQAVIDDLCTVVAELFIAESKLLKPSSYGLTTDGARMVDQQRGQVMKSIHSFVSSLPFRYALSADTPSEVLVHMRLVAAVRSDPTKVAVHIHNITPDEVKGSHAVAVANKQGGSNHSLCLVTISCRDAVGLLEYISKLLSTGGSCVLDADVMLSKEGIVLDRFTVQTVGRLRLDKLSNLIEAFLREYGTYKPDAVDPPPILPNSVPSITEPSGPLYVQSSAVTISPRRDVEVEIESAIPLNEALSRSEVGLPSSPGLDLSARRAAASMPDFQLATKPSSFVEPLPIPTLSTKDGSPLISKKTLEIPVPTESRQRKKMINRRGRANLDDIGNENGDPTLDYLTVPDFYSNSGVVAEPRAVPLIPFDEIMLIETLGTGRVSTIYRAAWQRNEYSENSFPIKYVKMIALKVAMVDPATRNTAFVDELRREADIAARLSHPNVCDLVGVAADSDCFCLAYEYCEGGSLLSLLSDPSRYYEYLPIAMDIANAMAYLHSRNVIHRDLKPANILLTRDHRVKIADFGMSVANTGQELTAETGTYRYMAPEVIRHESYSSNADVYSFGICLWQLITREVPFATMTPIQAAYAVAEGRRPPIPPSTPRRLQEIMSACWDQESNRRPSFTYVAMALADYAKMAFSPANVGTLTLQIANEMLAKVEGNSTVNVDISTQVLDPPSYYLDFMNPSVHNDSENSADVGLEIE